MRDIAQAILRRPRAILLVVLGFVGPTLVFTLLQPTVYEASAKLVVGQKPPDFSPKCPELPARNAPVGARHACDSGWELLVSNQGSLQLNLPAVADAIDKRPVAEEVIQRLGLKGMKPAELVEDLSVEQEGSTVFIQLSYKDADPERAQRIVNTVGVVSSERIPEAIGSVDIMVTMYEDASVPSTPANPDPVRSAMMALILGLTAGIGVALMMEQGAT